MENANSICYPVKVSIFSKIIFAHFLRPRRKKPGFPGVPPRLRRGRFQRPCNPLRPTGWPQFSLRPHKQT
jgi:hypothetical protein